MNWATIAPETRIYKGKSLFRWEDSPGLEHHCGTCATPLHNSRAKTTCIGKHVEPCYRFHQQLHFVGKSHECFGCNSSDEMHHNRHKEILRIVRQISALDIDQVGSSLTPGKLHGDGKGRRESSTAISTGTVTDTASESTGMDEIKQSRRERKKMKKAGNSVTKMRRDVESFPIEELDFVSEALHLSVHESKGAWEGTYVYDHKKEAINTRIKVEEGAIISDTQMIASSVHDLAVKLPIDMTPRQRKTLKKFYTPIHHSSFGGGSKRFSPHAMLQEAADPFDGVDPAIFFRLGVEIASPIKNSKARKDLVTKLVAAIKEDLDIIYREESETQMREDGFWRWAGKTAWHTMKETRRTLDWATGQKINGPRPEEFVDGDIGIEFSEVDMEELKTLDTKLQDSTCPKREANVEESPSPSWKTVPTKKSQLPKKKLKRTKMVFTNLTASKPFEPVEEEERNDDFNEMMTRYQQSKAGERSIGGVGPLEPDYRRGGRKLTLKLK